MKKFPSSFQYIFFCLLLLISMVLSAQELPEKKRMTKRQAGKMARQEKIENYIRQQEEGALVFDRQTIYGLRLNTDGWNMFFERARMRTVKTANFFYLEIGEKKHPKEKKITSTLPNSFFVESGSPYVYGKQNIFYQLKPGYGQQRMIGAKANKNGIALHWIYSGGMSVGLLRPYYVNVIYDGGDRNLYQDLARFSSESLLDFNNRYPIGYLLEGTSLKYGWNEMKIVPGLHAKSGLRFDYGRFNELVSAIEVGFNAEYYFNDIEILVNNNPQKYFFNAYVAILIGKRN
jgi:hypothetical protein